MPLLQIPCTESEWIEQNKFVYNFYYEQYPLRESGIILPVSMLRLRLFYNQDMKERNLMPLNEYLNCYEFLFNYLIGRISNMITFKGSNWFDRFIKSIPIALGRTYDQLTSPFGIPLFVWIAGGLAVVIILKS